MARLTAFSCRTGRYVRESSDRNLDHKRRRAGPRRRRGTLPRHNAGSIAEIRVEESALGEEDAIATQAQLPIEKRIGFLILTTGISVHLVGLVLKSPEGPLQMGALVLGVVAAGLIFTMLWTRFAGRRVREQARRAKREGSKDELPEQ